jgi:succinate dehydrogenase/fumarate reductase-like Fe-S protein
MPAKKTTLRILRYKAGHIDPPRYQEFSLEADPDMSVLEALEAIRLKQDSTLMYRHSCTIRPAQPAPVKSTAGND